MIRQIYISLLVLLVAAIGTLAYMQVQLQKEIKKTKRELVSLKKIKSLGEDIYQHQQTVSILKKKLSGRDRGDLNMPNLLNLSKKHKLKPPSDSTKEEIVKRTYVERKLKLKFKHEKLKDLIKLLIDIEKIGNSRVSSLVIVRDKKNKDLWRADIHVSKILPKRIN